MAGTLHLVCGKIAAGRSTLCVRLAAAPGTILIAQDRWMKRLWAGAPAGPRQRLSWPRTAPPGKGVLWTLT